MKNQASNIETTVATTTILATANSTDKLFGYSSVLSKDSTKVKDFSVSEKGTKKVAKWSIEQNGVINSYVCEYSDTEKYLHGTVGRYLQSISTYKNETLHSFGNTPIIDIQDFASVFNIPIDLLNMELVNELCSAVVDFSHNEKATSEDIRIFLAKLDDFGLTINESNQYASKIQSLTSLQKNYVYYKDKTSTKTSKAKWTDSTDIVLTCRFNSDADKKGYAFTIESIINDAINRVKSNDKKKTKLDSFTTFEDKKAYLFSEIEANTKLYIGNALSVKVEIVNKESNAFDIDSLL